MNTKHATFLARVRTAWLHAVGLGCLFLLLAGCVAPTDRPLLWVIEGDRPSYLYGTIHLPDARVLALPQVVEQALDRCDEFCTEIPMDAATHEKVRARMRLPDGQTLKDVLPPELYQRTNAYFKSKLLRLGPLSQQKVWVLTTSLVVLDYIWNMLLRPPLDKKLHKMAVWRGKRVAGLETVEEQLAVFDSLSNDEQIRWLEHTLDVLEQARRQKTSLARQLVEVYLRGDEAELLEHVKADYDLEDDLQRGLFAKLITQRNERLAERIEQRIKDQPDTSFFFAVGAAHLAGADGVVARLNSNGFNLRRVMGGETVTK